MDTIGAGIVDQKDGGPEGVGGWLLVFCVWAAVIAALGFYVGVTFFLGWTALSDWDASSVVKFFALSALLIANVVLIVSRKKFARTLALATCGLLVAVNILAIGLYISGLTEVDLSTGVRAARDIVLSTAWFLYFLRSRRVRNTLVK